MVFFATVLLAAATATVPSPAPKPQLPVVPNVAPGYAAPKVSPPPPSVVGVTQQPFVGITLENAIGMALSRNPDLAIAQANRHIAQYQVEAAKGAYDINFDVEPQYQYVTQAPTNPFFAGRELHADRPANHLAWGRRTRHIAGRTAVQRQRIGKTGVR